MFTIRVQLIPYDSLLCRKPLCSHHFELQRKSFMLKLPPISPFRLWKMESLRFVCNSNAQNAIDMCTPATLAQLLQNNIVIIVATKTFGLSIKVCTKSFQVYLGVIIAKDLMMHVYHFLLLFLSFIGSLNVSLLLLFGNVYLIVESFPIVCEWTCVNVLNTTGKNLVDVPTEHVYAYTNQTFTDL